jgi:hypothetical protein
MADKIRNIIQSHGEREVVKTAPDIVVYIEGRPYLINRYINSQDPKNQSDGGYTVVNFNDFVDSFSASYDIDNLVPSGSITLSVPNNLKRLFQSPAGAANILEPMMEVQVFAKGYFPSVRGNTLYYRVFKGLISSVSYVDPGTNLQITVGLEGTLRLLEIAQVDLAPAIQSNSPLGYLTVLKSDQSHMDPYKQLADTFLRDVTTAGFQMNSLQQATVAQGQKNSSDWADAIHEGYILRWQAKLANLVKDVRILGYQLGSVTKVDDPYTLSDTLTHVHQDAFGSLDPALTAPRSQRPPNSSPADTRNDPDMYIDIMRKYLPDMSVSSLQLLNGKITSRLERIRSIVNLIMYEGYQDLDGAIIFKPPLYNLDVTNGNIGTNDPNSSKKSLANYITPQTNPFVVYLSEIVSESETEDEHAVRVTRMTMQGDWLTNYHFDTENSRILTPIVDHIDIAKLSKFGLREEPARQLPFIRCHDTKIMYAYAASEMARTNRGYRTYSITIPLRPEIRLGFPMYFPHKDMYGYIKTIGINYQQGQSATMQITTDTVRKRLLIPSVTTINGNQVTSYTSQPYLVMQWTKPPNGQPQAIAPTWSSQQLTGSASGMTQGGSPSTDIVNLIGNVPTQRQPQDAPFSQDEWAYIKSMRESIGSMWSSRFDTKDYCYRVQNDITTADDEQIKDSSGTPQPTGIRRDTHFFSSDYWQGGINWVYYYKILNCQPYTDEKGYEVVSPFPWGRWVTLLDAIRETRLGILTSSSAAALSADELAGVQSFLFAGMAAPNDPTIVGQFSTLQLGQLHTGTPGTSEASGEVSSLFDSVELDSVIELETPDFNYPGTDNSLTQDLQPDMQEQVQAQTSDLNAVNDTLGVFLTGGKSSTNTQTVKQLSTTKSSEPVPVPTLPTLTNPLGGGNS